MNKYSIPIITVLATLTLGACSTGGGAGDSDDAQVAIDLITPLAGRYSLPPNWAGMPESEAYLEILEPDDAGEAIALLYRIRNAQTICTERNPSQGEVVKDPFSEQVFMNRLFEFDNAVLSSLGNNLIITLVNDVQDIDNDGNTTESAILQATFFAADLPETCQ